VWKPKKTSHDDLPKLRVFTALEYAQLSLEDKPT